MTLKFLYTRPDGGISIIHAAPKEELERVLGPLTDAQYRAHVLERSVPEEASGLTEVTEEDIPRDRTFRNAWEHHEKSVDVNMEKARDIWRDKLRIARAPLLKALDTEYMRADEVSDVVSKANIAGKKQVLRDVTEDPAIEAAQTPEELKAVWPAVLG